MDPKADVYRDTVLRYVAFTSEGPGQPAAPRWRTQPLRGSLVTNAGDVGEALKPHISRLAYRSR